MLMEESVELKLKTKEHNGEWHFLNFDLSEFIV